MVENDVYRLFDRDAILALSDDRDFLDSLADELGVHASRLGDEDIWDELSMIEERDLEEEVARISERFDERVRTEHVEWAGDYLIMAMGTSSRWDGVSSGYRFYSGARERGEYAGPFARLCSDTGFDGVFKDCTIDSIWEDRDSTVHVEGVHHDGRVRVACRAVAPDTEELLGDLLEWNGLPIDEAKVAKLVADAWEGGVRADMAGCYGYIWPDAERDRGVTPNAVAEAASKAAIRDAREDAALRKGVVEECRKGGIGR